MRSGFGIAGLSRNLPARFHKRITTALIWACLATIPTISYGLAAPVCESASDWVHLIRALVDGNKIDQAVSTVDEWLKSCPDDLDARTWHARLQAWTNHWKEAESEYHTLIQVSPRDVDLLMGLADVLIWQTRYKEALPYLEQARELDPYRSDCNLRHAQVLQRLGRAREAQIAYQEILAGDATSTEARKGLYQIQTEKRHEVFFNFGLDNFNYAENAESYSLELHSRWNDRWATFGSLSHDLRFGEKATGASASVALNFTSRDTLTVGASLAENKGIVPRREAEFGYGHGFRLSETGPIRGIEASYGQRWLWYRDTHLMILTPSAILYLPRDWNWLFQFSSSRITTVGNAPEWKPSGSTRLSFPIGNRFTGHFLFATGTENFGYADQIGQYSMHTWGTGLRIRIDSGQEVIGHANYQRYSGDRTMTSVGVTYALHF